MISAARITHRIATGLANRVRPRLEQDPAAELLRLRDTPLSGFERWADWASIGRDDDRWALRARTLPLQQRGFAEQGLSWFGPRVGSEELEAWERGCGELSPFARRLLTEVGTAMAFDEEALHESMFGLGEAGLVHASRLVEEGDGGSLPPAMWVKRLDELAGMAGVDRDAGLCLMARTFWGHAGDDTLFLVTGGRHADSVVHVRDLLHGAPRVLQVAHIIDVFYEAHRAAVVAWLEEAGDHSSIEGWASGRPEEAGLSYSPYLAVAD